MEHLERIAVLENEIQAQLLAAVLRDRGIPHLIRSYHDSAYDGLFQSQRGWGHVEAPAGFKKDVLAILEDLTEDPPPTDSPA